LSAPAGSPQPDEPAPRLERPSVILVTGNMASGKSTVAQALAQRLPMSVHLRGDVFRRMIVNGQVAMGFELDEQAYQQLKLRYRLAAEAARLYLEAGFVVVYQDIVIGPELADVVSYYRQHPLYVVVLCPAPEVVAQREAARGKTGYENSAAIEAFDRVLREQTPRLGLWLDSSRLSVNQTVDTVLKQLDAAFLRL
jgi:predicted kinase